MNKKKSKKNKKYIIFVIFVMFLFLLIMQQKNVFLQHDDYGYATLNYVYEEDGVLGRDYTINQLFHYLTEHWKLWGGRILSFAQMILLLKNDSLIVINLFQSVCICVLFFLMWFVATREKEKINTKINVVTSFYICLLYGFIDHYSFTSGIYWYAASSCYVWPIMYVLIATLAFWSLMFDELDKNKEIVYYIISIVFSFIAGFSMEQIGIMIVIILFSITCYSYYNNRDKSKIIKAMPILLLSLTGFLFVILAPGNKVRQVSGLYDYYYIDKNFIGKIIYSIQNIITTLFSFRNLWFVLLFTISSIACASFTFQKNDKQYRKLFIIFSVLCMVVLIFSLYSNYIYQTVYLKIFYIIVSILFAISTLVNVYVFLVRENQKYDILLLIIIFGAYVSIISMLVSPMFTFRNMIMFEFIWFMFTTRLLVKILTTKNECVKLMTCIGIIFIIISVTNLYNLYNGYKDNIEVNKYNENQFIEASKLENDEIDDCVITLMKIPDERYGEVQPYNRTLILEWMREYYSVSQEVPIVYIDYNGDLLMELEGDKIQDRLNITNETIGNIDLITTNKEENDEFVINVKDNDHIELYGWAIDEQNQCSPGITYIKIGEYLFRCNKIVRTDVADFYKNAEYTYSGFYCNIILGKLKNGTYPIEIVVLNNNTPDFSIFASSYTLRINK